MSNSRADRAAERYRLAVSEWQRRQLPEVRLIQAIDAIVGHPPWPEIEGSELREAVATIADFRAMHAYPLRRVTSGVRIMAGNTLGPTAPRPGQRLKRMDRILDKLLRFPTMRLSQMDDIGGCRLVLRTLDDVYLVTDRINRRWPHAEILDYIDAPKPDGYRSVHVVERRDGRLVEVQLRTRRQHDWAEAVEDARGLTGYDVKNGMGPVALRRYFRVAAHRLALEDAGQPPDPEIEKDFGSLIEQVRSYYAGAR